MNNVNLQDANERQRALDPTTSFIVQAPAGSGKTELLTQRFLVLLGNVKQPEEILAITFTKKSAGEMRARIIKALKNAVENPEPLSAHEKQTWTLAKKALQRNISLDWNLLDNPNRLQIQTIDSFNASLTRQLPLLSHFGAPLELADDATFLYREAVQEFLSHLEENFAWVTAIEKLLLHMDNDLAKVENLLVHMLAKRDQWLPYIIANVNNPELRNTLETSLKNIVTDTLSTLQECFPSDLQEEVLQLSHFATANLHKEQLACFPGKSINEKSQWNFLAEFLLTKDNTFRKSINKKQGFPAPSEALNSEQKALFTHYKNRMLTVLENLSNEMELQAAFADLAALPEERYYDFQWSTLDALHDILRVVVAQLKLVFQQHGKIDYIENALAALTALGTDETPTDITLALDYRLQHILIDEFQDTSNGQYRLLEKLITGWETGDGRTLFVVGDPMQSIYRFREAEVGLFIRARQHGISHLKLEPLTLSVNFRSIPGVVNWVNENFSKVLPPFEDIASGAVSYSQSIACRSSNDATQAVQLHAFVDSDEQLQAAAIIRTIQASQKNCPQDKIAILVRSRSILHTIIKHLKNANLSFRALDIEPLTTRPVIQDLMALTRALLHPADRIAWLTVLRAPWCGLTLSDLLILAGDKTKQIIWEQLKSNDIFIKLTKNGQQRLSRCLPIFEISLAERRRYNLREWVEYTWLNLGGPACVEQSSDLDDANAYFNLLDKLDEANDLADLKILHESINKLYAAPNNHANDGLQIMTMHNAKGLEFDIVILPHLERKASQDDKQLMLWMERPRSNDSSDLVLAPIQAVGEKENLIYDYIKRQNDIKTKYENGRLLYVAATRAKKQLHMFFNLEKAKNEIKTPTNNSLLQKLWPSIEQQVKDNYSTHVVSHEITPEENNEKINQIKRLSLDWNNLLTENKLAAGIGFHQKKSGFLLPQNNPRYIGTLIHQILQQIAQHNIAWWQDQSLINQQTYIKNQFLQLGMLKNDIDTSSAIVEKAIQNTLNDKRGQWILLSHNEAKSELPLTYLKPSSSLQQAHNLIIDRTFIDENGVRWIIDYKSSSNDDSDLESFLELEKSTYAKQLQEYCLALRELDSRPIKVGLYFPLIPAWREWEFERGQMQDHDSSLMTGLNTRS